MNVWLVNPFDNLPPEGNRPQRYWLMARAFVQAGHHVTFWTSDFSHATKARRVFRPDGPARDAESFAAEGFEVRMIPTLPYPTNVCWARARSHRQLARDFERAAASFAGLRPDLVVASMPPLGLCAAAMKVAKAFGARFVCDVQDAWPETFERLLPTGLKWTGRLLFASMRATARRIYREADVVTGVCRRYAELSGRKDFYLAYHGIARGYAVARGSGVPKGRRRLAYVGSLGVGYDLEPVVAAVAKRPELSLDVAGSGPQEPWLRERAHDKCLGGRVRFHGYLDARALHELMAACDVGVIPMRDDSWVGMPNKLVDYLSAGLPVLSSLNGDCGEILRRTGFGRTYERKSPDSLLSALDALPDVAVTLPDDLCAESIYPKYVERVAAMGCASTVC